MKNNDPWEWGWQAVGSIVAIAALALTIFFARQELAALDRQSSFMLLGLATAVILFVLYIWRRRQRREAPGTPAADVTAPERQTDAHVYAPYNLTPAEIALTEGRDRPASSDRFSGQPTAEAVTTNAAASVSLLFTGQPPQGSFPERLKRVTALAKLPTPAAVQELTAALVDDNPTIRWLAATTLEQVASEEGGQSLQVVGVLQSFVAQTDSALGKAEAEKLLGRLGVGQ